MVERERPRFVGQRRALQLVDQNNACLNERVYNYGVNAEAVQKQREELEGLRNQWYASGAFPAEEQYRIIDIEAVR